MTRKVTGEKLEKVISTKITTKKYELLEKYAREYYIQKNIDQPTVSVLLRTMIDVWLKKLGNNDERKKAQTNTLTSTSIKTGPQFHDWNRMLEQVTKLNQG
ncbi:MAG: hypothetical protein ABJB85_09990 [Nitrososphaerota archaeon]